MGKVLTMLATVSRLPLHQFLVNYLNPDFLSPVSYLTLHCNQLDLVKHDECNKAILVLKNCINVLY